MGLPQARQRVIADIGRRTARRQRATKIIFVFLWTMASTLSILAKGAVTSKQPALAESSYGGFLRIQLCVSNGYFAVDCKSSNTWYSNTIPSAVLSAKTNQKVAMQLIAMVDGALKTLGPAYFWALPSYDQTNFPHGPANLDTKSVAQYSGTWAAAGSNFCNWQIQKGLPVDPSSLENMYLKGIVQGEHQHFALSPTFSTNFTALPLNFENTKGVKFVEQLGWLDFDVLFFTTSDLAPSNIVIMGDPNMFAFSGVTSYQLARRIAWLQGDLWSPDKLHRQLDDEFTRMGYLVSDGDENTMPGALIIQTIKDFRPGQIGSSVELYGAPRLDSILILEPRANLEAVLPPLYEMLSTPDFEKIKAAIINTNDTDVLAYPTNKTQYSYEVCELPLTNDTWHSLEISGR